MQVALTTSDQWLLRMDGKSFGGAIHPPSLQLGATVVGTLSAVARCPVVGKYIRDLLSASYQRSHRVDVAAAGYVIVLLTSQRPATNALTPQNRCH